MKKCTKCGNLVPDNNIFCPECGSSIFKNVSEAEQNNNTNESVNQGDTNETANNDLFSDSQFYAADKPDNVQPIASPPNREIYNQPVQNNVPPEHVYEQHPINNSEYPNQVQQNNQTQPAYGIYQTQPNLYQAPPVSTNNQSEEKANAGLIILSILIPIAGLILYCTQKKDSPKSAKSYGKAALISAIICTVLSIAGAVFSFYGAMKLGDWATSSSFSSSASDYDDNDFDTVEDENADLKTDVDKEKTTEKNKAVAGSFSTTKIIDYDNMQFAINGKVYTLGKTTLQDIVDDGVSFDDSTMDKLNNIVEKNTSDSVEIKLSDEDTLYVDFGNFSDKGKAFKDCVLDTVSYYTDRDEKNMVTFPFSLDITESEFKEKAGTPTDTSNYSSDGYVSNTYEYKKESSKYYNRYGYEFNFANGKLHDVYMSWIPA